MTNNRIRLFLTLLACFVTGCDQWTKHLIRQRAIPERIFFGGAVQIVRAENRGAFLSLGDRLPESLRIVLLVVAVAVLIVVALIACRGQRNVRSQAALVLIVSGGVGNLIDRVTRAGFVTDFLFLRAGPLHTGVFNVADVAIMAGILSIAFYGARGRQLKSAASSSAPTR